MDKFVIEGTVSELEVTDDKYIFKICGTEGYSVNRGEKKFNVIWSDNNGSTVLAYMRLADKKFEVFEHQGNLLTGSITGGKRIRITIEMDEKTAEDMLNEKEETVKVSSITLLAD